MIPSATETRCPSAITYAGASRNFDNDDNGQCDTKGQAADEEALQASEAIEATNNAAEANSHVPAAPQNPPAAIVPARRERSPEAKSPPRTKNKGKAVPKKKKEKKKKPMASGQTTMTSWLQKKVVRGLQQSPAKQSEAKENAILLTPTVQIHTCTTFSNTTVVL
ncbi:hypothetical protein EKO04_005098 [Ascochyta lentis]|uniref:Uncharacterized protein n=1 Tax=Ascochyta lentis TaxID=205686 RepID=A0A8H7ME35_9PLEO|nr:hypothetical protein EKO04_005098 [Ascochyta lentis]